MTNGTTRILDVLKGLQFSYKDIVYDLILMNCISIICQGINIHYNIQKYIDLLIKKYKDKHVTNACIFFHIVSNLYSMDCCIIYCRV